MLEEDRQVLVGRFTQCDIHGIEATPVSASEADRSQLAPLRALGEVAVPTGIRALRFVHRGVGVTQQGLGVV